MLAIGSSLKSNPHNLSASTAVSNQRCGAFTLVELMVVLVLVGVVTALMIPEMRGTFENAVLRGAAREVVNACNLAHSRSVTRNEVHRLRIDRARSGYVIEAMTNGTFAGLQDVPGSEGKLDNKVELEISLADDQEANESSEPDQGRNMISFYHDGTADAADIALRDRQGFQISLRVNPTTARIEIVERAEQK
jgi:type II secretion system protein H